MLCVAFSPDPETSYRKSPPTSVSYRPLLRRLRRSGEQCYAPQMMKCLIIILALRGKSVCYNRQVKVTVTRGESKARGSLT